MQSGELVPARDCTEERLHQPLVPRAHPPEAGHEAGGPAQPLIGQQTARQLQPRRHRSQTGSQELEHHRRQLPIGPQFGNPPLTVGLPEVIAQERGNVHRHGRTHRHLELEIAQHDGAEHDIEIAMELDVARTDKRVVETVNLLEPHVRLRTDRIFNPGVSREGTDPAVAVVHSERLRRPLDRGEQLLSIHRHDHQDASTNSMPTVRISASAFAAESGATATVRSTSTLVVKPARAASSAVRRTQWSVAMPTTSTPSTPRCRNHSSSGVPFSSTPSKPLYAAPWAPLRNTASIGLVSRAG